MINSTIKLFTERKYLDLANEAVAIYGGDIEVGEINENEISPESPTIEEIESAIYDYEADVILVDNRDIQRLIRRNPGVFMPLTGLLNDNFYAFAFSDLKDGNDIYGLPCFSDTVALYYQKEFVDPTKLTTWEELYEYCKELDQGRKELILITLMDLKERSYSNITEILLKSMGYGSSNSLKKVEGIEKAFEFLEKCFAQGFIRTLNIKEIDDFLIEIQSRKVSPVFIIDGLEWYHRVREAAEDVVWGVTKLPISEDYNTQVSIGGHSWMVVDRGNKEKQEEIIYFLLNAFGSDTDMAKGIVDYMVDNYSAVPVLRPAVEKMEETETNFSSGDREVNIVRFYGELGEEIETMTLPADPREVSEKLREVTNELKEGNITVEEAVLTFNRYSDIPSEGENDKELSWIEINGEPNNNKYLFGEFFEDAGTKIIAHYTDGFYRQVALSKCIVECSAYSNTLGFISCGEDVPVTISYTENGIEKNVSFLIDIYPRELLSIEIDEFPYITKYLENELFNPKGLKVSANYAENIKRNVQIEKLELNIMDKEGRLHALTEPLTLKDENLLVSYADGADKAEETCSITVTEKILTDLRIIYDINKKEYLEGECIDLTGLIIDAQYSNITWEEVGLEKINLENNGYLEAGDVWLDLSYTYKDVTKTIRLTGLNVSPKKEANAKINQSKLTYGCGIGAAAISIDSGESEFECPIAAIGTNDYVIKISGIYRGNMKLSNNIKTYMGKGWKLNVQQYLYVESNNYFYVDGQSVTHEFEKLGDGRYYDTSGYGLILTIGQGKNIVTDQYGNKMYFSEDVLIKTESGHNAAARKIYSYTNGKLSSIYDGRTPENRIEFIYDDSTGLLIRIKCVQNIGPKINDRKEFYFTYDTDDKLVQIEKRNGESFKPVAIFSYQLDNKGSRLLCASDAENKSALRFEYEEGTTENRVEKVSVGVIGEDFTSDSTESKFEETSSNTFIYEKANGKVFRTFVTNEKGVKVCYYLNENGITTAILEAAEGNAEDLRSMEKRPGISVLENNEGTDGETINGCKAVILIDGQTWTKELDGGDKINKYRKNKYHACKYFTFSFWVKITKKNSSDTKLEFTVNANTETKKSVSFDGTAENAWQLITIPMEIREATIEKVELTIMGAEGCKMSDMRIWVDQRMQFQIRSEDDSAALEEFTSVRFLRPGAVRFTEKMLSDGYYMSEKDLQMTYYSMATSGENQPFILSLCDNTERHIAEKVFLHHAGKNKDFALDLPLNGQARFCQEILSSDGKTKIVGNVYFGKDENGDTYNGICQQTQASSDGKSSSEYIYTDYKGLLKKERDEYGVETEYEYDAFGRLTQKTIGHGDISEKLVFTVNQTATNTTETTPTSRCITTFDGLFGNVKSSEYGGKNEISGFLTTTYTYDTFNERVMNVRNDMTETGEGNDLYYNERGLLKKVVTSGYGYMFEYDQYGNVSKSSFIDAEENEQKLTEYETDYALGTTTEKKYRKSGQADETIVRLDKYGRTAVVAEKNFSENEYNTTTFMRQELSESAGVSEVKEMYDPYEDRTYLYGYDEENNCTGYTVKIGSDTGDEFFQIRKSGENKVAYNVYDRFPSWESEIVYESDKLLNPRIAKTSSMVYYDTDNGNAVYEYDQLGRIHQKTHNVYERAYYHLAEITTSTTYKWGTILKETLTTQLEYSGEISNRYEYSYEYDNRGQILKESCTREYYIQDPKTLETFDREETVQKNYTYDKANRLKTESTPSGTIEYTYYADGSIKGEHINGIDKSYIYSQGRLIGFSRNNEGFQTEFGYDNYGNCTHYKRGSAEHANMEWERGSFLKRYTTAGTDGQTEAIYHYNSQGIRYKKEVGGEETTYYLDGEKLIMERTGSRLLRYNYDQEGILGVEVVYEDLENHEETGLYHYVKDGNGNVVALMNSFDAVALYEYDAWGNTKVLNPDGTENLDSNFIGNINPIRWKSQYYDTESELYYIGGRYYSPLMKRYISPGSPEEALTQAGTVYGLNPYLLCLTNPVNMVYNGYTIEPNGELVYDPEELSEWSYFWKVTWNKFWNSKLGKGITIGLFVAATVVAYISPAFLATYIGAVAGIGLSLGVGGLIGGIRSRKQGNSFWAGFTEYINENWSQTVAISMAIALISFGISQAAQAMKKVGPQCFKAGTLVACLNADGKEIRKRIEEIEVGDKVFAYDDETGEQAYKPVLQLFKNETKQWCTVCVEVDGQEEEIISTPGHKYYLPNNTEPREVGVKQEHESYIALSEKWVSASKLKAGDKVLLSNGEYGIIQSVKVEELSSPETTYNLEVEDFHTYYVGENSVCVHNRNCGTPDLYRGGTDMTLKSGEYRLDSNGLVKPTHGLSVNADPNAVSKFGGAYKIQSIPEGLKVIQRGRNLMHYEIVPQYAMTLEHYQALLYQVQLIIL